MIHGPNGSAKSVKISGSDDLAQAIVDRFNLALVVMDEVHYNIHRGIMFQADYFQATLADDGAVALLVQVDDSQPAHMRLGVATGGDAEIEIYEGPTISASGTGIQAVNRNRISSNTPSTLISHTPTISVDGISLSHLLLAGGTGFLSTPGGQGRTFEEWVLQPGENYLVRVTNRAGTAQPVSIGLDFYEPSTS